MQGSARPAGKGLLILGVMCFYAQTEVGMLGPDNSESLHQVSTKQSSKP